MHLRHIPSGPTGVIPHLRHYAEAGARFVRASAGNTQSEPLRTWDVAIVEAGATKASGAAMGVVHLVSGRSRRMQQEKRAARIAIIVVCSPILCNCSQA